VLGIAHGGLIVEAPVLTKHYLGPRNLGMTIGIVSVAVNLGFALVRYRRSKQGRTWRHHRHNT
jgi:hypothetical protein